MDTSGRPSAAQIVILATSTALTAALYTVYKSRAATVIKLKEAKKVPIDQDLQTFLSETPGKCVPYAVIEGVVKCVKEHLSSQFVDSCKGVIERLTLKEKKMVWNRTTHLWNDTEKVIHQRTNTVPFALGSHDEDVTTTVRVIRPLDAEELELETVYEHFHPTAQSLSKVIGHFISGERPKGIQEAEEMLRLDDSLTGVGELVLDNNIIKLQPPKQGFSFFLSRLDYESLLRKQEKSVRLWKILTIVFGIAACSTLLFILWRQYVQHRKRKEERSMFEEFREQQRHRMRELDMEEDNVPPNFCSVCLSRERSCVFLDCGHVCACTPCYEALPQPKKCPICRAAIDRMVPLFNS